MKVKIPLYSVLLVGLTLTYAYGRDKPDVVNAATSSGVRISIKADAWSGEPPTLTEVIPILVEVENNSKVPVQIRYQAFRVTSPSGADRFVALPTFNIKGTEVEPITTPLYPFSGFLIAPHHHHFFPFLTPFHHPFDHFAYYDLYYPRFVRYKLPTVDMLRKALPEGVLQPGGKVTGFLYFDEEAEEAEEIEEGERAHFVADLINADTGKQFGTVTIPFPLD